MIQIKPFVFNFFSENTYVVFDQTKEAIIVDPGCYSQNEKDQLATFISKNELQVKFIINTHGHIDHVLGNHYVKELYGAPVLIHPLDVVVLKSVEVYAPSYGIMDYVGIDPDGNLEPGQKLRFGNTAFDIIFVPGHAPGHIALIGPNQKVCISGDVLFYESIGRTDLPGGNHQTLLNSIHQKMFTLDDDMVVYPGHGPTTTIGHEKAHNPFCLITN